MKLKRTVCVILSLVMLLSIVPMASAADKDNEIIALIYYDPYRNENCEMFIMEFEVREDLRRKGHGKLIIKQFLREHSISAELLPLSEESVLFWRACGFKGDRFGLYYYPRSLNIRKMRRS